MGQVTVLDKEGEWVVDSDVYYAYMTFASPFHLTLLLTLLACGATVGFPSDVRNRFMLLSTVCIE